MTTHLEPTYVTVADDGYFLGAVALVNSLRLTGNAGPIVVMDAGLTADQRARLSAECDVRPVPVARQGAIPWWFKPQVVMMDLHGVVILIDSDMIATGSLSSLYAPASGGQLCAFPDGDPDRHFAEWQTILGLTADLRRQTYVSTGFVAFDVDSWAPVVKRWWDRCDVVRLYRSEVPWGDEDPELVAQDPFFWGEQDTLNAMLMSEVDASRTCVLDQSVMGVTWWPHAARARIADRRTLAASEDGRPLAILHYWDFPKPWAPDARTQRRFEAYVELMARLLTADDVPISLPASLVPTWLRDDLLGRLVRRGPRRARRAAKTTLGLLPEPAERWVRRLLRRE